MVLLREGGGCAGCRKLSLLQRGSAWLDEQREMDGKIPLIMFFKDGNKHNYRDNDCQLSCYNCYFLRLGNVFTERDMESLEGHQTVYKTTEMVDFQLDDYQQKRLKIN